jgi:hypothetical protein
MRGSQGGEGMISDHRMGFAALNPFYALQAIRDFAFSGIHREADVRKETS